MRHFSHIFTAQFWIVVVWVVVLGSGVLIGASRLYSEQRSVAVDCREEENTPLCYTRVLNTALDEKGVGLALDMAANFYAQDSGFSEYCHGNLHDIGARAYEIYHETGDVEITPKASYCGFGFYHGFMEKMFAESGSLRESRDFCAAVGEKMRDTQRYAEGACYHGIGHGVTDGTDPTVWGDPISIVMPGLKLCRQISDTDEWLMRCASGTFNSLALLYRDAKYKLPTPRDPYAVCETDAFSYSEKEACYSQMNTLVAFISDHDAATAVAMTQNIADPELRRIATLNVAALPHQWGEGEVASIPVCRSLGDFGPVCIRGVVAGMMEFGTPGKEADRALAYCNDTSLTPNEKRECVAEIVVMGSGMFSQDRLKSLCDTIPDDVVPQACRSLSSL